MSTFTFGPISITIHDDISIPQETGQLDKKQQARVLRARGDLSRTTGAVAAAMRSYPTRIQVTGVTADGLESRGKQADEINSVQTNLKAAAVFFMQASLLIHADAHNQLRRINKYVQSQESWDPTLATLVPELSEYFFTNRPPKEEAPAGTPAATPPPAA